MRKSVSVAVVGCALLAGCATMPLNPIAVRIVSAPSKTLVFTSVRAGVRGDVTVVRGRVARRTMMGGAVWGHVHVEALSGNTVLAWADTRWTQLARRRLPTSFFQAQLPTPAVPIDEIRVSHRPTGHGGKRNSGNPS